MIIYQFKIYPEEKHYYRVLIFDTKKNMIKYWKRYGNPNGRKLDFEGICNSYEIRLYKKNKSTEIIKDDIGFILLYRNGFGSGVVSHEITHATTYWCKTAGFHLNTSRIVKENDERYAYALGNMVTQFWIEYYKKFPKNNNGG